MALKNARGSKLYYDYSHRRNWPEWERHQMWLTIALGVGALLICTIIFLFFVFHG